MASVEEEQKCKIKSDSTKLEVLVEEASFQ